MTRRGVPELCKGTCTLERKATPGADASVKTRLKNTAGHHITIKAKLQFRPGDPAYTLNVFELVKLGHR